MAKGPGGHGYNSRKQAELLHFIDRSAVLLARTQDPLLLWSMTNVIRRCWQPG
jgi:hypothetical protein